VKSKPLKELCDYFGDGDWIESKDQSETGFRLIQTGNIGVGQFKDRLDKSRWISEDTFGRLRCTEIFEGDVLISRLPDPVGRACLIPKLSDRAITAVDCSIVRFKADELMPEFFIYYTQSPAYANAIQPLISGATRERVSRERLGTVPVPILPMESQKEIVSRLDEIYEEISVIETQLATQQNVIEELTSSIIGGILSPSDSSALTDYRLGDICKVDWGNTKLTKSSYTDGGLFAAVSAAGVDGRIGHAEHEAYTPVLSAIGAKCGRMFLPTEDFTAIKNTITLTPKKEIVGSAYLFRLLQAVELPKRGAGQPFISKGDIQKFEVKILPRENQDAAMDEVDSALEMIREMSSSLNQKHILLTELKNSILTEAFAS
jgi:type I restriction enzyme S subunit